MDEAEAEESARTVAELTARGLAALDTDAFFNEYGIRDAVLPLDRRVDDPVELYVGDRLIARGELEELGGDQKGQLAVRLTEVADMQDGF